jgi:uncharacterized protein
MSMETRILPQSLSEVRVITNEAGKIHIPGRGIVFNQLSQNLGWFKEIIDPRALEDADMSDIVSCFNHDMNIVLGRTTSGTLSYSISAAGVDYDILPPETSYVKDIVISPIERKDVTGSSFMFTTAEEKGDEWDYLPDGTIVRYVRKIAKVYEFGPVTMPAYTQTYTDVAKRSFESHQKTIDEVIKKTQVVESEYRSQYARLHLQLIKA